MNPWAPYPSYEAMPADGQVCSICTQVGHELCFEVSDQEVGYYEAAAQQLDELVVQLRAKRLRRRRRRVALALLVFVFLIWRWRR